MFYLKRLEDVTELLDRKQVLERLSTCSDLTDSESFMERRKHDESLIKDRERWAPMLNQHRLRAD